MTQSTSYDVEVHRSAKNELIGLRPPTQETVKETIIRCSEFRQPTEHAKARRLRHVDNIFRLRVGDYRIFCQLESGVLQVLKVDERDEQTYERGLQEAQERAEDTL